MLAADTELFNGSEVCTDRCVAIAMPKDWSQERQDFSQDNAKTIHFIP